MGDPETETDTAKGERTSQEGRHGEAEKDNQRGEVLVAHERSLKARWQDSELYQNRCFA